MLGLAPAIVTFVLYWKVRREVRGEWNPARLQLAWAFALACLGAFISLFLIGLQVIRNLNP